jgi:hypothetical protein
MRLKSEIFVSALVRRVFGLGAYAAVLRKGAGEAGAIFIRQRSRLGTETLYAPAPQSLFDDPAPGRLFEIRLDAAEADAVDQAIAREIRFDPGLLGGGDRSGCARRPVRRCDPKKQLNV